MMELPWRELRGDLHRFIARRVPRDDADDIVQDAMTRIYRGASQLRDHERVTGWIYQVAHSAIGDHYRRRRPYAPLEDEPALEPDPDDVAFASLAACVRPFIGMLAEPYREAITLVELDRLSQVEAAARLGIPVSTMKSRVQRGRAQLRELLETCCSIAVDTRGHVIEVTPRRERCAC